MEVVLEFVMGIVVKFVVEIVVDFVLNRMRGTTIATTTTVIIIAIRAKIPHKIRRFS